MVFQEFPFLLVSFSVASISPWIGRFLGVGMTRFTCHNRGQLKVVGAQVQVVLLDVESDLFCRMNTALAPTSHRMTEC